MRIEHESNGNRMQIERELNVNQTFNSHSMCVRFPFDFCLRYVLPNPAKKTEYSATLIFVWVESPYNLDFLGLYLALFRFHHFNMRHPILYGYH